MDLITIVQVVEGSLSLALQCGNATKTLRDIAAKYKYAKLTIISMVEGLDTIQLVTGLKVMYPEQLETASFSKAFSGPSRTGS